jgi:hypothetical protein
MAIGTTLKVGFDAAAVRKGFSGLGGMFSGAMRGFRQIGIGAARDVGARMTDLLGRVLMAVPQGIKETLDWAGNLTDTRLSTAIQTSINNAIRQQEYAERGIDTDAVRDVQRTRLPVSRLDPGKVAGDEQVSLADIVLSGGEMAALTILDACIRLLPGVMGATSSGDDESFEQSLIEYPHYTRPQEWEGRTIPEVLRSGDHAKIAAWRKLRSEEDTRLRRPDLWERHEGARVQPASGARRKDKERRP